MENLREYIKGKQRIVIKIGSSSLQHAETGDMDYVKIEKLVRALCDICNQGKEVVLVSSGAIAAGKKAMNLNKRDVSEDNPIAVKQACAAVGQARLMMVYQKMFSEYNHIAAQILMTKNTIVDDLNRFNAHNTFMELLKLGAIPIVNENDTVATYEIEIGDNDTLSAIVAAMIEFIETVDYLDERIMQMGRSTTGSSVGTGGMGTKLTAAKIATKSGADMIIANSKNIEVIHQIMEGENVGTLFKAHSDDAFDLKGFVADLHKN